MQPYGIYPQIHPYQYLCVKEVQDTVAKGCRIRNKQAKRRFHKKRLRNELKRELNYETSNW